MFKQLAYRAALGFALIAGAVIGLAAPIPFVPSTAPFNEPNQEVATLNALINQLNGQTSYAPAQLISIGQFCANTAGATPQTCNGQRGIASFTGVTAAGNANSAAQVINNSFLTAASNCQVNINGTTAAGASGPVVSTAIPGAGTLTVIISNTTATTTGASTFNLGFNCT